MTDGVFAFAMTLLVINIELPQDFHPATNREFLAKLSGLSDTFTAYLITFFVLIGFWSGRAQKETGEPDMASPAYTRATLLHLLGRHLPAVLDAGGEPIRFRHGRLYLRRQYDLAGGDVALVSRAAERDSGRARVSETEGRVKLGVLIAAAVLSMLASLYSPDYAMLLYLLVLASPLVARVVKRG